MRNLNLSIFKKVLQNDKGSYQIGKGLFIFILKILKKLLRKTQKSRQC